MDFDIFGSIVLLQLTLEFDNYKVVCLMGVLVAALSLYKLRAHCARSYNYSQKDGSYPKYPAI